MEGEGLAGGVGGRGSEGGLGFDYCVGQHVEGGRGRGGTRSRPAVKAASEVELRTRTRMSGSAEAWRTMCASSVHMLRGQRGEGRGATCSSLKACTGGLQRQRGECGGTHLLNWRSSTPGAGVEVVCSLGIGGGE